MERISVFTKPWQDISLEALADLMVEMGADAVELPVRDGFQVEPERVADRLPEASRILESRGIAITSIAGAVEEPIVRAAGEAGVPLLRVCIPIDLEAGYFASVEREQAKIARLEPILRSSGVRVGVQNHCDRMVGSALGLHHFLAELPPDIACAVLDFAHCVLDGEPIPMAVDMIKDRLGLVNFKNAYRARINGPDEAWAEWNVLWTTARHGGYSWPEAVAALDAIGYSGDYCIPAEYGRLGMKGIVTGDEAAALTKGDVRCLRELFAG